MPPSMLMRDCNHPTTAQIAQHHPYLLRIHDQLGAAVARSVPRLAPRSCDLADMLVQISESPKLLSVRMCDLQKAK